MSSPGYYKKRYRPSVLSLLRTKLMELSVSPARAFWSLPTKQTWKVA